MKNLLLVLTCLGMLGAAGCAEPWQTGVLAAGGIGFGAQTPSTELEQTYYLGMFDPLEQLPSSMYRITVRGQSGMLSNTKFASGWLPAQLVDSLGSRVSLGTDDPDSRVRIQASDNDAAAVIKPERRMMMFGPEGFREAPSEQRLVLVMGSSPEKFFKAADEALGLSVTATEPPKAELSRELSEARGLLNADRAATSLLQSETPVNK